MTFGTGEALASEEEGEEWLLLFDEDAIGPPPGRPSNEGDGVTRKEGRGGIRGGAATTDRGGIRPALKGDMKAAVVADCADDDGEKAVEARTAAAGLKLNDACIEVSALEDSDEARGDDRNMVEERMLDMVQIRISRCASSESVLSFFGVLRFDGATRSSGSFFEVIDCSQ